MSFHSAASGGTESREHAGYDVRKVANFILDVAQECELSITNMALQKILYFAHGWYLALFDRPLVDSCFEAWQYGPVHPQIYRQFKAYGDRPISSRATRIDLATGREVWVEYQFEPGDESHIRRIVNFYAPLAASRLSTISHEAGAPWDRVWNASGSTPGMAITDTVTREYYRSKLNRKN